MIVRSVDARTIPLNEDWEERGIGSEKMSERDIDVQEYTNESRKQEQAGRVVGKIRLWTRHRNKRERTEHTNGMVWVKQKNECAGGMMAECEQPITNRNVPLRSERNIVRNIWSSNEAVTGRRKSHTKAYRQ